MYLLYNNSYIVHEYDLEAISMNSNQLTNAFTDIYFKTTKGMANLLQSATAEFHVSFEQYQILRDIAHQRASNLTELVQLRGVTKPAIARQLRTLRSLEYINQTTASADHRRHVLSLTRAGAAVEKQIESALDGSFDHLVAAIGEDEVQTLTTILEHINDNLLQPTRPHNDTASS
jgi:DNA-binding MarR family transcriptional regulator